MFSSCSKETDSSVDPIGGDSFEEVIARGGEFPSYPQSRSEEVISESMPYTEEYENSDDNGVAISTERFECVTKTVSVLDGNGQFQLFDSSADVIYPGSLLQGATLSDATPSPIVVRRAGGTISYNLNNGNVNSSFAVEDVKKSSIQDGMNNIISNAGDVVPANFQLEIIQVESESQMALEMGINIETYTTKVAADMSFSSEKEYNRMLVKLNQSYYTMSFDLPTSLDQIFHPSVTPEQLSTYVQEDNPATFISSVTYGRIFYMLVESTSSREEMSAKLDLSYEAFKNKADGELDAESMQSLKNLKIKVIAYGGDTEGTFQLAGETSVNAIASKLAETTEIKAGLPLSYVVRSVERPDQIVGTKLATEYDQVECQLKGTLPPSAFLELVDLFSDDEDGGGIGALLNVSNSNILIFNNKGTDYAWFNAAEGKVKAKFNIKDPNSPLGVVPLDEVGAAVQLGNTRLYLFNKTGLLHARLAYSVGDWGGNIAPPTTPMGEFTIDSEDGDQVFIVDEAFSDTPGYGFGGLGFEAGVRVGRSTYVFFPKPGDQHALYTGADWKDTQPNSDWFDQENAKNDNSHTGPELFKNVGAACHVTLSSSAGYRLLVSEDGNELMQYRSSPNRHMDGPWVIN